MNNKIKNNHLVPDVGIRRQFICFAKEVMFDTDLAGFMALRQEISEQL